MVTTDLTKRKVLLHVLKDFSGTHTITTLTKEVGISRVGTWKIIKRLEKERYIYVKKAGIGKTSASLITLNWANPLLEKTLSLYLSQEAQPQRRWQVNFAKLEPVVDFLILYGSILHTPQKAHDIDIVGVVKGKNRFVSTEVIVTEVQKTQSLKIHSLFFGPDELKKELLKNNRAFIDSIKMGVVLFGQEKLIAFMRRITK